MKTPSLQLLEMVLVALLWQVLFAEDRTPQGKREPVPGDLCEARAAPGADLGLPPQQDDARSRSDAAFPWVVSRTDSIAVITTTLLCC